VVGVTRRLARDLDSVQYGEQLGSLGRETARFYVGTGTALLLLTFLFWQGFTLLHLLVRR
jgi:hypothetical protein